MRAKQHRQKIDPQERTLARDTIDEPREHQIAFYADRLCLTERYLGTLVHQVSGVTAQEWIDRAIIMEIKVKLRHTNLSLKQISDDLNFPNPSIFSKYFKRLTSMTPLEYKLSS